MKVFISWSGERSKEVAEALHKWLPCVINSIEPWMSEVDIPTGVPWFEFITKQLKDANFGIICLTKDNYNNPNILFEVGALAKTVGKKPFVCPYLIDLTLKEFQSLPAPLTYFQAKEATEKGTRELIHTLYNSLDERPLRSSDRLDYIFDRWWPDLKGTLDPSSKEVDFGVNSQIKSISYLVSKFNPDHNIAVFKINPLSDRKRVRLTWETFGKGIVHLADSIKSAPGGFNPEIIFGINAAGLMIAAYLSDIYRTHLGIIKTDIEHSGHRLYKQFELPSEIVTLDRDTIVRSPNVLDPSCIAVVDSELKSGRSIRDIIDILENKYKNARIFYLVLGGVIHLKDKDKKELNINDFGWEVEENKYKPDFLAFYVNSPGFEPPGGIR